VAGPVGPRIRLGNRSTPPTGVRKGSAFGTTVRGRGSAAASIAERRASSEHMAAVSGAGGTSLRAPHASLRGHGYSGALAGVEQREPTAT
jgi:hypothetical protein